MAAFPHGSPEQLVSAFTSLLVMRRSRRVYSGTMMKHTSLRQDREDGGVGWGGGGWRASGSQKARWIESLESGQKRL